MGKFGGDRESEEEGEEVKGLNEESEGRHFRFWLSEKENGCEADGGQEDNGGRYRRRSSAAGYPPSLPTSPSTAISVSSRDVSTSWKSSCTVKSLW